MVAYQNAPNMIAPTATVYGATGNGAGYQNGDVVTLPAFTTLANAGATGYNLSLAKFTLSVASGNVSRANPAVPACLGARLGESLSFQCPANRTWGCLAQREARSSPPVPLPYGMNHQSVYHVPTARSAERRLALRPCLVALTWD